jgi:hypothetical protein
MTRGPFGRLPKSLCDFGDMTPHTLVGGAQIALTATASARADRRDWPSEAWGPRGSGDKTHTPPLGALDRRAGATGAVGMGPKWLVPSRRRPGCGAGVKGVNYML